MLKLSITMLAIFGFLFTLNVNAFDPIKIAYSQSSSKELSQTNQIIFETNNICAILPFIANNTLVVFDIDYTLFRSKTSLGTPEWIFHFIEREMKKGKSREESFKMHYEAWMRAQQFNEIVLLDNNLPMLLKEIKKYSAGIIALTSRQPISAKITQEQLSKFNFNFFLNKMENFQFLNPFKSEALFEEGILFAHDFNEKGKVFAAWLQQLSQKSIHKKEITKVVFVDDMEHNIQSMAQEVKKLGLEFVGVHYTLGDKYKKNLVPQKAAKERQILMSNISNAKKRKLLKKLDLIPLREEHFGML